MSPGLAVVDLTVSLGAVPVIRDASFSAPSGALTALVGPNGAGKSTLLGGVAGALAASGRVELDGVDLGALRRRDRARRVALVEQDATTELPLTVDDVVALGRTPHQSMIGFGGGGDTGGEEAIADAIDRAGIRHLSGRDVTRLSGGERQRVLLARALAQRTPLLLLDEPTNHLDVSAQLSALSLLARLAEEGTTVVAALHDLGLAASAAAHVIVLADGSVVAEGPPLDVLTPELLAEVYRVRAAWSVNPLTGSPLLAVAPLD